MIWLTGIVLVLLWVVVLWVWNTPARVDAREHDLDIEIVDVDPWEQISPRSHVRILPGDPAPYDWETE